MKIEVQTDISDDMLLFERRHPNPAIEGNQRIYRLPNGFGMSFVNNSPNTSEYPDAWEAALFKEVSDEGECFDLIDIVVFRTNEMANVFIELAREWAEENMVKNG